MFVDCHKFITLLLDYHYELLVQHQLKTCLRKVIKQRKYILTGRLIVKIIFTITHKQKLKAKMKPKRLSAI